MIEWCATLLSLLGIYLNAKKNIACWFFWFVGALLWIIFSLVGYEKVQWSQVVLWSVFAATDLYGWYSWRKEKSRNI